MVREPARPTKTMSRQKMAKIIKMGLELTEQNRKRRSCVSCNEKGHDLTGCSTKKMERKMALMIFNVLHFVTLKFFIKLLSLYAYRNFKVYY